MVVQTGFLRPMHMNNARNIPIFPLPMVACPTEWIPLHIFEERYKDMIQHCRDCEESGSPGEFVILLTNEDEVTNIGSTVRICQILREHEDGRLDIMTVAQQRCRIVERYTEHSYDSALIEILPDQERDWDESLATEAFSLHRALLKLVSGDIPNDSSYSGKPSLSFYLAQSAGMTTAQKQEVLEARSENARLELLIRHFKNLIVDIQNVRRAAKSIQSTWEMQLAIAKAEMD